MLDWQQAEANANRKHDLHVWTIDHKQTELALKMRGYRTPSHRFRSS
jgi:hypothetical protein